MRNRRRESGTNREAGGHSPAASDRPCIVSLVSLGCAKNLVDSERILGQFAEAGFLIAEDPAESDVCLVNTCGFIHDAREETGAVLRELVELKRRGRPRFVVALGCMVERANDVPELARFVEAADARLGFRDYPRLAEACRRLLTEREERLDRQEPDAHRQDRTRGYAEFLQAPRLRIGSPHTAYLKISEGCSNSCRFCSIPSMRGRQVSRPVEQVLAEARQLADGGARELNLIAQDTTSYGRDLYGELRLAELLRALAQAVREPVWLRLLYAYPRNLTAEVLEVLAGDGRFCPYVDLPLQHIADPVLKAMGRGVTRAETLSQLDLIERKLPGAAVRTTFLAGFPGETEADFEELLAFVREGRFTHAGVFTYSAEPGTLAAQLEDRVSHAEKERRREALMLAQREVSRARQRRRVGTSCEVLVDGLVARDAGAPPGAVAIGRSQREAPEVDGVIFLRGARASSLPPGKVIQARVVAALDYDLVAEPGSREAREQAPGR